MQQANGERTFCFLKRAEAVSKTSYLLAPQQTIFNLLKGRGSLENQPFRGR